VVPRSFLGPLAVSIFAAPLVQLSDLLAVSKFLSQYVGKYFLGSLLRKGILCHFYTKIET